MAIDIVLPPLGESVVEGTVVKWLVKPGDRVAKDQALLELATDKANAEVPSPQEGVVAELRAKEGDVVAIGAVVATLEGAGAAPASKASAPVAAAAAPAPAPAAAAPVPAAPAAKAFVTPTARNVAAEAKADPAQMNGTGIGGRVTKADVLSHLDGKPEGAPAPAPAAPSAPARAGRPYSPARYTPKAGDQVLPFDQRRRLIAEHMQLSKRVSPHVTTVCEVDMSRVGALRKKLKAEGHNVTYLIFLCQATVRALQQFPRMNALVQDDALILRKDVNLGVAVDTEDGLIVPVVRRADEKSLTGLAHAVDDLATRAKNKKASADELSGGSFTVSNPGLRGNLFGTPIINQPQVGIVRMGEIVKRAVVVEKDGEDAIVIRPMMYLALSYDHRVVDGVLGNSFLRRVKEHLEAGEFA